MTFKALENKEVGSHDYRRVFEKIRENAEDGLKGSKSYKDDRLLVIAGMAASAMLTIDEEQKTRV